MEHSRSEGEWEAKDREEEEKEEEEGWREEEQSKRKRKKELFERDAISFHAHSHLCHICKNIQKHTENIYGKNMSS